MRLELSPEQTTPRTQTLSCFPMNPKHIDTGVAQTSFTSFPPPPVPNLPDVVAVDRREAAVVESGDNPSPAMLSMVQENPEVAMMMIEEIKTTDC